MAAEPAVASVVRPAAVQRPGHTHEREGFAPPVQKEPEGQGLPAADVAPAAHAEPGAAVQGVQTEGEVAPVAVLKVPGGHSTGMEVPLGQ